MEAARIAMVDTQVRPNDVHDRRVIAAFARVPREEFLPEASQSLAYLEKSLETAPGRYLWRARDFSKLVQSAEITETDCVLDIAPGTGYSTEILSSLAAHVTALENQSVGLAALKARFADRTNIEVIGGPLATPPAGPFNVIIVNGAVEAVPAAWIDALADGGRLAVVVRDGQVGRARLYTKAGTTASWRVPFDAAPPSLPGFERPTEFRL